MARRAGVAAATAVSAAALACSPAYAAEAQPQGCTTAGLKVWLGQGSGAAGSVYYPLELTNISGRWCTLYGYPGVSAVGDRGHQLGRAAGRDPSVRPRLVVVAPGRTAHAVVRIVDVGDYPKRICRPVTAKGLRVYPPNRYAAAYVPFGFRACSAMGPVYLSVRAVQPGVGIPGRP
jgi:hypothetical protein